MWPSRPCHPDFSFRNSPNDVPQSLPIISKPKSKPFEIVKFPPNMASPPLKPTSWTLWFSSTFPGPLPRLHRSLHQSPSSLTHIPFHLSVPWSPVLPGSCTSTSPSFHFSKAPWSFPLWKRPMVCRMAFFTLPHHSSETSSLTLLNPGSAHTLDYTLVLLLRSSNCSTVK